ncbi:hypothetical protein Glove_186g143 [Diversispora epigaea]|uniref:PITH domain-containing protein n=1 Tax=Diversispora epigaea TaxID=1348612 RepID=A0A397IRX6_9GLOM|nr:hypothetical protein Glove_186g143 [Diversispora epigaea]
MSNIKNITNLSEYQQLIASPKLTVVDFHATWCGPCRSMAPIFETLSSTHRHANFAKVDTDQAKSVSSTAQITSLPTFKLFKNGRQIGEVVGARQDELRRLVELHAGTPEESGLIVVKGHMDINEFITLNQVDCLNQLDDHNVRNIFKNDDNNLESDVDEQLLITIPFNQTVKLHSLKIVPKDIDHAPKTIKLYVNRLNLGFDETDSIEETQLLELTIEDYEEEKIIPLRFVKFQSVTTLVIFVQDNIGDEETTIIKELKFIGSPAEAIKMENWKGKNEEES